MTGVEMVHVPYRGGGPALNDLIPGRVDVLFGTLPSTLPLARNGTLRALAVSSATRAHSAPDIPTVTESGVPGFELVGWNGLFMPARTPQDIIAKVHKDAVAALAHPSVKSKLEDMGVEVTASTPSELAAYLKSRWSGGARSSGRSASRRTDATATTQALARPKRGARHRGFDCGTLDRSGAAHMRSGVHHPCRRRGRRGRSRRVRSSRRMRPSAY